MLSEDPFAVTTIAAQMLFCLLFVIGVIVLRIYVFWRKLIRRREEIERHKDAGTIGTAALIQGADLPFHYDRLARIGIGGPAEMSLDQRVLRPSVGVRLFVLGLCAAMLYFAWQMLTLNELNGFEVADPGPAGTAIIGAMPSRRGERRGLYLHLRNAL